MQTSAGSKHVLKLYVRARIMSAVCLCCVLCVLYVVWLVGMHEFTREIESEGTKCACAHCQPGLSSKRKHQIRERLDVFLTFPQKWGTSFTHNTPGNTQHTTQTHNSHIRQEKKHHEWGTSSTNYTTYSTHEIALL